MKNWKRHKSTDPIGNTLFDISPKDLYQIPKTPRNPFWQEDWSFYQGMLKHPQEGSMTGRDKVLEARRKKAAAR